MEIVVKRFADNGDTTLGALYINGKFQCFTVEDEEREVKVSKETRVPDGTYKVALRAEGGFHNRYSTKYGDMHRGMLAIYNAPHWKIVTPEMEFQYVLIHTGNTDEHTAGCLLLNDAADGKNFVGSGSVNAYKRVYPIIRDAILAGEEVKITYIDIEDDA